MERSRYALNAKQAVRLFAQHLNVNPSTVQKWGQGAVRPQNAALKLLNLVSEHGAAILVKSK